MDAVIVSAVRTATGRYGKSLKDIPATELGAIAIKEAVKRAGIEGKDVDEVIMGNVISAGLGQAPARQAAISAGIPVEVPAFTINKVCASGLKAVALANDAIKAGTGEVFVAGGMENMSRAPYLLYRARFGYRMDHGKLYDSMVVDGLWDVYNDFHMGMTAEIVSQRHNVTREDMDAFALESHRKAWRATEEGWFKEEIVPIELAKGMVFDVDEGIRKDTSMEALSRLPPVFKKDGLITAGNASQLSDGGAATVVMSSRKAEELGVEPLARIVAHHSSGVKPEHVMEAPISSVKTLLKITNLTVDDIDLFEHNEAFAAASVAVARGIGIPFEKLNVNGGAVALGHPLGCSGTRILTTLLHEMRRRKAERGLATLCLGGGNAVSMIVERV